MRRALVGLSVLGIVLGFNARAALAAGPLTFQGGPMKNLYVDLIFWGNFSAADRQAVLDNVNQLSYWLNGGSSGPGLEPAVHYYGVSGITPGAWLINPSAVTYVSGHLDDNVFQPMVWQARVGVFGPAYNFQTNVPDPNHIANQGGVPTGSNRLALVITKGTETYCNDAWDSSVGICDPHTTYGYHWWSDSPYGAVMSESPGTLSHEVMEAMTDASPFSGWKVSNYIFASDEVCDGCGYTNGLSTSTVNSAFIYGNQTGGACTLEIPEQHAPLAATFEYGFRSQPLMLFYVTPAGHVATVEWSNAGQPGSAPYDLGQPSSSVTAVGKPTVTYSMYTGGERVFVKGSDAALWMLYNGTWTSLGGGMYGDPYAVVWNGGNLIDVFVLGGDDKLYYYGMTGSTLYGWSAVPNTGGTSFVGSPTVISRAATSLDVFAVGEDGRTKWMALNSNGWAAPVTLSNPNDPIVAPVGVAAQNANQMDLFGMAESRLEHTGWNGSTWSSFQGGNWQVPDDRYGLQGTPAVVSSGSGRTHVFAVSRHGELWWWYSTKQPNGYTWQDGAGGTGSPNPLPLVTSGVTGDPLAISRGSGEVEVFYRNVAGSLVHLTYANGAWASPENLLPANSIR